LILQNYISWYKIQLCMFCYAYVVPWLYVYIPVTGCNCSYVSHAVRASIQHSDSWQLLRVVLRSRFQRRRMVQRRGSSATENRTMGVRAGRRDHRLQKRRTTRPWTRWTRACTFSTRLTIQPEHVEDLNRVFRCRQPLFECSLKHGSSQPPSC